MAEPTTTPPTPPATPPANPPATPPASTPPAADLAKLSGDDLSKVLENPELWNLPRIKELRDHSAAYKKLQDDQAKAADQKLADEKKFEELANNHKAKVEELTGTVAQLRQDQALTNALVKLSVVDLDGALKLIDRSKLTMSDTGQVTGVDEAIGALKTDRAYLFTSTPTTPIGAPANGANAPANGAPMKFKQSQLNDSAFYAAHRDEILAAQKAGLIEMGV